MTKVDVVRKAMMDALKAGDKPRKEALSLLLSALKAKTIDKREDLSEDEANAVVYREIKEAQETLDTTPADRTDVIEECRLRMAVYAEFAPARMDEAAIREVIEQTLAELGLSEPTARDKGKLMKALMPRVKDKADGALVNRLVGRIPEIKTANEKGAGSISFPAPFCLPSLRVQVGGVKADPGRKAPAPDNLHTCAAATGRCAHRP